MWECGERESEWDREWVGEGVLVSEGEKEMSSLLNKIFQRSF